MLPKSDCFAVPELKSPPVPDCCCGFENKEEGLENKLLVDFCVWNRPPEFGAVCPVAF